MCTKVNFEDFIVIHHEMGHIQYYLLYKDQPIVFRAGANPGNPFTILFVIKVSRNRTSTCIDVLVSNFNTEQFSGFHEAVGDTIALSVSTPRHFKKIGLLQDYVENEQTTLNALMDSALERIAFLPYGLIVDKWRWDVFSGKIPKTLWNSHWWMYR